MDAGGPKKATTEKTQIGVNVSEILPKSSAKSRPDALL